MKAWLNKGEVGAAEINRQEQFRVLVPCFRDLIQLTVTPTVAHTVQLAAVCQAGMEVAEGQNCCDGNLHSRWQQQE